MVNVEKAKLEILKGQTLREYTFHTRASKHWFCSICGIHTHHNSRNSPTTYAVNIACVGDLTLKISQMHHGLMVENTQKISKIL